MLGLARQKTLCGCLIATRNVAWQRLRATLLHFRVGSATPAAMRPCYGTAAPSSCDAVMRRTSSTRRAASAWTGISSDRAAHNAPACRAGYRKPAAAAAMNDVPRGGLMRGLPLDRAQLRATGSRCRHFCSQAAMCHAVERTAPQSLWFSSRWMCRRRFPFSEPLTLQSGDQVSSAQVIEAMAQFVEPARLARINQVRAEVCAEILFLNHRLAANTLHVVHIVLSRMTSTGYAAHAGGCKPHVQCVADCGGRV